MSAKHFVLNLFGEHEEDTAEAMRRKLFLERMERKLEFKKSLRSSHHQTST